MHLAMSNLDSCEVFEYKLYEIIVSSNLGNY